MPKAQMKQVARRFRRPSAVVVASGNDAQVGDSLHDRGALIMDAQALVAERLILL